MRRAVSARHKIQELRILRIQSGMNGCRRRHRNGRRRQSRIEVGIVGPRLLQVASLKVAVKALADAVNDRGIGLQRHAQAQAVVEH